MQSAVPDGKGGIAAVIGLTEEEVSRVCKKITINLIHFLCRKGKANYKNVAIWEGLSGVNSIANRY